MQRGSPTEPAVVVEHYWPAGTPASFAGAAARLRTAVDEIVLTGALVHLLHATFVPDEGSAFCVFSCSAPELVEEVYERAALAYDRMLSAVEISPASLCDRTSLPNDLTTP
jgi:hypothetical protein